jgi:hypothetical protein
MCVTIAPLKDLPAAVRARALDAARVRDAPGYRLTLTAIGRQPVAREMPAAADRIAGEG